MLSPYTEKPIEIVSPLKNKSCVENQTVKFEIELNKPNIMNRLVWLKDGQEIVFDKAVEEKPKFDLKENGNKYTLVINKAQFEDEAQYTVKLSESEV